MQESAYLENNQNIFENLKNIDVMAPFEENELYKLMEMSKIRQYKAGECIVQEGRIDSWLYFLMRGQIQISKKGKEITVLDNKGEIFGEMGAMNSCSRSASAYALTDTVCLATDMFYVDKLNGKERVSFGYVLYRLLAEILSGRLRRTTTTMIQAKGKLNLKFW